MLSIHKRTTKQVGNHENYRCIAYKTKLRDHGSNLKDALFCIQNFNLKFCESLASQNGEVDT